MLVYQVRHHKIYRLTVQKKTETGFHIVGKPICLQPSKRNTFRRLKDAKIYLDSQNNK
jgi:hypothetical protein